MDNETLRKGAKCVLKDLDSFIKKIAGLLQRWTAVSTISFYHDKFIPVAFGSDKCAETAISQV
jgi:hypothetical protein